jgi:hypothetical protein
MKNKEPKIGNFPREIKNHPVNKANFKRVMQGMKRMEDSTGLTKQARTSQLFGCKNCAWISTDLCPHELKRGQQHVNGICSQKAQFVKDYYLLARDNLKYLQTEKLLALQEMTGVMREQWFATGRLPPAFAALIKSEVALMNKMRDQDEGIKIKHEHEVTVDRFREIVEVKYKEIEEKKKLDVKDKTY